ncbi:MAG: hypothetical protein H5U03_09955, partial [Clostridia bacterium]|nr:hypothetical protein [Clostridia bacterium]
MAGSLSFEVFLDPEKWHTFDEHIALMDRQMEEDVAQVTAQDQILKTELRQMLVSELGV